MAKQIYIDENGNEQLVSGTINNASLLPISGNDTTNTKSYIDSLIPDYIKQVTGTSVQFLVDCTLCYYYADQWLGRVPFPFVAKNINYSITIDDVVADNIGNITAKCSVNGKSQSYFEMITTRTMPSLPNMFSVCGARCRFTITFA